MELDNDLDRDAQAAFSPSSVTAGSLLPYEGRSLLQRPEGLPDDAFTMNEDGWLSPNNPVLVRRQVKILPLAWRGDADSNGGGVTHAEIAGFASQMQNAGMYWAGNWRVPDLSEKRSDSIGSYLAALRDAGATRVNWWTYSESVGIALVWAGQVEDGTMSLALHIVPVGWVSERHAGKAVRGIDVRWSWAEVSALASSRSPKSGS